MMQTPLLLVDMFKRAETYYAHKQIISRTSDTMVHRLTYGEWAKRTRKLAHALTKLGMKKGDKIASFAWNQHRHLEAYFAVPCAGACLHMVNIRLSPEHVSFIINHAEDKILIIDEDLVPIIESIQDELKTVEHFIIMADGELPQTTLPNAFSYEQLLVEADETFEFPTDLDENTPAGMCYTSATTGNPKGVVYTQRSIVLHSMMLSMADSMAISERDVIMPIVPMFHVNAWGMPFASVNVGATQVLIGPQFTPALIVDFIEQEGVTKTAGVPTIWLGAEQELEKKPRDLSSLHTIFAGGSASPKGLIRHFEEKYGVNYVVVYGMTETSPIVALSNYLSKMDDWAIEDKIEARATQGLTMPCIESSIVNEDGEVPWDGETMGELRLRGPWIASEYFRDERTTDAMKDGWLYTGDIAVRSKEGFIKITDRTKDLIKSGGEWISSVDLENGLMSHPEVFEAAVIAIPHPKWQERPLACVVVKEGATVTKEELMTYLEGQFAKWWMPDDIVFLEEIPKTSVGKFLKAKLRENIQEIYPQLQLG
ncbi:long-chain fatty acid--CoA ligase [Lysinibacillus sp. KU-BSD001]|uniref:long-chain fatty acid--CoA ligase n=1 Tax=Lysinibacillus sp. KU-BSD001 TaxID=3141328 RepID=UPI0036ED7AE6